MSEDPGRLDVLDVTAPDVRAAGDFGTWLDDVQTALATGADMDVPCGECTGCCRSSYFIHIAPDEHETLDRIPRALLFDAPGVPSGHLLMGYDQHGHCPMLVDDRCSIYEHRPRTCRVYDCRVFPATGTAPDEPGKGPIAERARRWRFRYPGARDRALRSAVGAAAEFLEAYAERLDEPRPRNTTQRAVRAIEVHEMFLVHGEAAKDPSRASEIVAAVNAARQGPPGSSGPAEGGG